ncbi:homoserine O-acetyltransferase [Ephemerocybe angulata]|uniref:Homoserine O-acetyltransferase n=1 Tax=Ephemerocybe angulata TaxID=980116 RepID=A0A8H6M8G5_9AGAR|nr:homoserine O-acetyltransferase [Tulosesus angulatus]
MPGLSELIEQDTFIVPSFELECGTVLKQVPVAYKTWGRLNDARDNVMIICHAFTGSADVEDWWGPLMGRNKAFDPNRFFIFCANVLGSPYGSASPVTTNPDTGLPYGPQFPPTTIRDDVRIHKLVLDALQVRSVAVVIGGSMGGMAALEWPPCSPKGYVRHLVALATSARHSAWCISWGEAQRQSIYSDPVYEDGFYSSQPASGLAAARMSALLTYRSRDSFESRFGRKAQASLKGNAVDTLTPPASPKASHSDHSLVLHNDGLRNPKSKHPEANGSTDDPAPIFSAQSYLRYQGEKFIKRFDANCYIHITRKLDTHDIARDRVEDQHAPDALPRALAALPPRALIISIATDGLFTPGEQKEIADHIPGAELVTIASPDGHDGFLLEFEAINRYILTFLRREVPELYQAEVPEESAAEGDFAIKKTSVFGEAEVDVTRW